MLEIFTLTNKLVKNCGFYRRPRLIFVNVDELYHNSLLFSGDIRSWAVLNGKYVALELRRKFVDDYLDKSSDFDYRDTDYYKFIKNYTREGFSGIYEGNRSYAVTNADSLCKRYIMLIDSIAANIQLYNNLDHDNIITSMKSIYDEVIKFERENPRKAFYFDSGRHNTIKESKQYEMAISLLKSTMQRRLVGHLIPSGIMYKNIIVIKNGSHRLAAFKAMKDKGIFVNKFPVYVIKKSGKWGIQEKY